MLRLWAPALIWLAVIVWESLALSSGQTSRFIVPLLEAIFPLATAEQITLLHAGLRKAGHFTGYAVLSLFLYRAWWGTLLLRDSPSKRPAVPGWLTTFRHWIPRAAALSLLGTVLVATLDEFQQSLNSSRTGTFKDVFLDTAGAFFLQMILLAISNRRMSHAPAGTHRRAETSRRTAEIAERPAKSSSGSSVP